MQKNGRIRSSMSFSPNDSAQQARHAPAGVERDQRQRVVAQRIGIDEGARGSGSVISSSGQREATLGRHDGAHAGAADLIDRHARGTQRLDDADMGEGARRRPP